LLFGEYFAHPKCKKFDQKSVIDRFFLLIWFQGTIDIMCSHPNIFGSMQLKPTAFKLAIVWVTASVLTACSSPVVSCDDPATPGKEVCGTVANNPVSAGGNGTTSTTTHTGGMIIYRSGGFYRSAGSTYVGGKGGSSVGAKGFSGRSGFGSTGGGRSGFG
jgi:hypothetical protein